MKNLDHYGIDRIQTFVIPEASRELPREEQKRVILKVLAEWFNHQNPMNYFPIEEFLSMDWSWKDASNRTLPQRIDKILKEHGAILPKSFLGALGNHVRESIPVSIDYIFDLTKSYNWSSGSFDDAGSCLWEGRRSVKVAMEKDPRFSAFRILSLSNIYTGVNPLRTQRSAIKTINGIRYYGVSRCWVFKEKARVRVGTKIKMSDIYLCFNSYGEHPIRQLSAVLATMIDADFKKIKVSNMNKTSGGLYINGSGYIVGPSHIIENIEHFDIGFQNTYDRKQDINLERENTRLTAEQNMMNTLYNSSWNPWEKTRHRKSWNSFVRVPKKEKNSKNRKGINDRLVREAYFSNRDEVYSLAHPRSRDWPSNSGNTIAYWRLWAYRLRRDFFRTLIKMIDNQIKRGNNVSTTSESKDSSESEAINPELQLPRDEIHEPPAHPVYSRQIRIVSVHNEVR